MGHHNFVHVNIFLRSSGRILEASKAGRRNVCQSYGVSTFFTNTSQDPTTLDGHRVLSLVTFIYNILTRSAGYGTPTLP